jgi:hypothetical protein
MHPGSPAEPVLAAWGVTTATSSPLWSHDWGYTGEFGGHVIHFNRARVVGGCSAHNAGAVVFGSRFDYDGPSRRRARA